MPPSHQKEYDRFGPYTDKELPYCGVVATPPLYHNPKVMHLVFVDLNQPMYCMPPSLFKEAPMHRRDVSKFRRDWLLDFGDGVQFDYEVDKENDMMMLITRYRKIQKPYEAINEDTNYLVTEGSVD